MTCVLERVDSPALEAATNVLLLTVFGGLALRERRWWPLPIAALSARPGLRLLIYLTLLAGVGERWLSGERPISEEAIWRRARLAP